MWSKESQSEMVTTYAWALDFWRAFLERPKIVRWMIRILIGKYARSELVGMKISVQKCYSNNGSLDCDAFNKNIGYGLENVSYHEDNLKYKDW